MAFTTRTLDYLLERFREGYRDVKTDVSLAKAKTAGIVGTVAARMAFTSQQAAQHIVEQTWPLDASGALQMEGVRLSELVGVHGVKRPPARKARMAVVVVGDQGANWVLDGSATVEAGGKTFARVDPRSVRLPEGSGLATPQDYYMGAITGDGSAHHVTWHIARPEGADPELKLSRWSVLQRQSESAYLAVVRRVHLGTHGLVDVYPVFPRGVPEMGFSTPWHAQEANARVVEFEATEAGFADFRVGDELAVDDPANTMTAWVLEADNGGDEVSTNLELARLLEMQLQGQAAGHNSQWWRELMIHNPDVALRDAYVFPSSRRLGTFDVLPIPQQGREVPEISAAKLQAYLRDNSPEDQDPRVQPLLLSPERSPVWVVEVTPQAGYEADPVGEFAGAAPPYGIVGVTNVGTASEDGGSLNFPSATLPIESTWGPELKGTRMLLLQCSDEGGAQVRVVSFQKILNNIGNLTMVVRSDAPLVSSTGSDTDLVGWLFPYSDLLPRVAAALAPDLAWPGPDNSGLADTTVSLESGLRVRREMFIGLRGFELPPSKTTVHGQSYQGAADGGGETPAAPSALVSWPPYSDHVYRSSAVALASAVEGVNSAAVDAEKSAALSGGLAAADIPALNMYEVPDVRILLDLQPLTDELD